MAPCSWLCCPCDGAAAVNRQLTVLSSLRITLFLRRAHQTTFTGSGESLEDFSPHFVRLGTAPPLSALPRRHIDDFALNDRNWPNTARGPFGWCKNVEERTSGAGKASASPRAPTAGEPS